MHLDYVDVFYSHRYDAETPLEETMQALVDIVRSGKALYVGISKYPKEVADKAYRYLRENKVPCLLYQGRYNLLNRMPEQDVLPDACKQGAGFVAFSPLAQGLLTDRYLHGIPSYSRMAQHKFLKPEVLTDTLKHTLCALREVALERGQTLSEMALAWLLKDHSVTSVIVGASSVEQLQKNLSATKNTSFQEEELQKMDTLLHTNNL